MGRLDEIIRLRPVGSGSAAKVRGRAVQLYSNGELSRRDLKSKARELESLLRQDIPDLVAIRSPRAVSTKPSHVGLMIYETRVVEEVGQRIVTAENHTIVLSEDTITVVSGTMPGGTRPHLFERVAKRHGKLGMLAEVQVEMTKLWPTLLRVRADQRAAGRGSSTNSIVTPFHDGLLFGVIEKVEGMPAPAGPLRTIIDATGTYHRHLTDFFGQDSQRVWATTNTFVDASLLTAHQIELRNRLTSYLRQYGDVVSENDWSSRYGLGDENSSVALISKTFKISAPSDDRRRCGLAALDEVVTSDLWTEEAARNLENQQARKAARERRATAAPPQPSSE